MRSSGKKRVLLAWSSGKDSAWALYRLRGDPTCEVVGLLTVLNEAFDRVAMHGVSRALLQAQADAAGLLLWPVLIPWPCANAEYERRMSAACRRARRMGIEAIAFGDLFLAEIRAYREKQLHDTGIQPLFPLWMEPTPSLARAMIAGGLRAKLSCVDPKRLSAEFAGREFDAALLAALPASVDPCAENGEFHTFCYDGPMFRTPIPVRVGRTVERDGFVFTDLTLASPPTESNPNHFHERQPCTSRVLSC